MQITMFYFSGTGNTSWISKELVKRFASYSADVVAHSIENVKPQDADRLIAESDIVGFGYPIYGSDLPQNMKEFLLALKPVASKCTFLFCTQWKWSGDGTHAASLFIKGKGFNVLYSEHFLMPNNVCTPFLPLPYTNDRAKIEPRLIRSGKKVINFAKTIISSKQKLRGFNFLSRVAGGLQRIPYRKAFPNLRNDIGIDQSNCTNCLQCVKICPSGNLYVNDNVISTTGDCILCLRCYNYCPESAITYRKILHDKKRGTPYRGPSGHWDGGANQTHCLPVIKN